MIGRRGLVSCCIALYVSLGTGCGESANEAAPTPRRERPSASIRLLDLLEEATIDSRHSEALQGVPPPLTADRAVLDESFAEGPGEWFEGRWERALRRGRDPVQSWRQVELPGETTLGIALESRGLHRLLPTDGSDALFVRARVRAPQNADLANLLVQSLVDAPADTRDRSAAPPEYAVLPWLHARPARSHAAEVSAERWTELGVFVPVEESRRGLRLSLVAEAGGLLVDRVSVQRIDFVSSLGLSRWSRGHGAAAFRGTHETEGVQHECLLLPSGSSVSMTLDAPERARFVAEVAVESGEPSADCELELLIDGTRVSSRSVGAANGTWSSWEVPLEVAAGRAVDLELRVNGGQDLAVFIGAPWVQGVTPRARPNLLLISIDTLRADRVGCYGAAPSITPRLDRLAAEGLRLANAYSPSSYTLPAHASLMSGQHPLVHRTVVAPHRLHTGRSALLATALREAGHRTAAFTGGGFLAPAFGFAQGFESYDVRDPGGVGARGLAHDPALHEHPPGSSAAVAAALAPALGFLERHHDQPFFLFFHTYFVHNYVADPEYVLRHDPEHRGERFAGTPFQELWQRASEGEDEVVRYLESLYLATLEQADTEILSPLLDALDRLDIRDDTQIVFVSDHGEEFQEHGTLGHGRRLWDTLVRVPLILNGPGIDPGVSDQAASLIDVARTVRRHLGLPLDDRLQGRDLLQSTGAPSALLLHLANRDEQATYDWDALVSGPWKLLREHPGEGEEIRELLFHRDRDPGETRDLAAEDGELLAQLLAELLRRSGEHAERSAAIQGEGEDAQINADLQEMLERLGYKR